MDTTTTLPKLDNDDLASVVTVMMPDGTTVTVERNPRTGKVEVSLRYDRPTGGRADITAVLGEEGLWG